MSTRKVTPVMHCQPNEPVKVATLGGRVVEGFTDNAALFPSPDPTILELDTETGKLGDLIVAAPGNHEKTVARDQQAIKVYNLLNDRAKPYVNNIAKGDKDKILLSG